MTFVPIFVSLFVIRYVPFSQCRDDFQKRFSSGIGPTTIAIFFKSSI